MFTTTALRCQRLPLNHPIHALLSFGNDFKSDNVHLKHRFSPVINPRTNKPIKRTDFESPVKHFADALRHVSERHDPAHPYCHPAYSIRSEFPGQIHTLDPLLTYPKKDLADPDFLAFVDSVNAEVAEELSRPDTIVIFMDGSLSVGRGPLPTTAVFHIEDGSKFPRRHQFHVHHATVAEAELHAISKGIRTAIANSPRNRILVYADSRAALSSLFDAKPHPAQHQSIFLFDAIRPWLHGSSTRSVSLRWCPSHSGVILNESVDKLCQIPRAYAQWLPEIQRFHDDPSSRQTSIGFARQLATTDASAAWETHVTTTNPLRPSLLCVTINGIVPFLKPTYRHGGGPFMRLLRTGKLDVDKRENRQKAVKGNLSTDSTSAALPASSVSQLTRCLTNHAPIGAFHERFHPNLSPRCPACPRFIQSRNHILFHCACYKRSSLPFTWFSHISTFLEHKDSFALLAKWLAHFPLAFTFAHSPPDTKLPTFGFGARFHPSRPPD